jgi:hypothetical protein
MFWKKTELKEEPREYYFVNGYKFTRPEIRKTGFVATLALYYLMFKALEGDTIAAQLIDAWIGKGTVIFDADNRQVYPPLK